MTVTGCCGACALCSIDPLTQIDHSAVITAAPDDAVLVVDGVFAFRPEINDHWDLRIWLDVARELSVRTGIERDQAWAGSDSAAVHRDRYAVAERLYVDEVDPAHMADLVIDNSVFDRPRRREAGDQRFDGPRPRRQSRHPGFEPLVWHRPAE